MRKPRRSTVIRVAAVALLVVIGRMLPHGRDREPATADPASVSVSPPAEGPAKAGIRILAAYPRLAGLGAEQAESELRQVATSGDADRLVAELRDDRARLARGYPGGLTTFWVGALATRSTATDAARARIEIWFARVVAPPRLPAYVEWRLGRLEVAFERDAWRLSSFEDLPGPRPASLPGEADGSGEILTAVDNFEQARP